MNFLSTSLLLTMLFVNLQGGQDYSNKIDELVRQSTFIFKGTVQKLNATTMNVVPATDSTVVVKVEELYYANDPDKGFLSKNITVQLIAPNSVKENQQAVFFTQGRLYGDSVAVVELGHIDFDRQALANQLGERVYDEAKKKPDALLQSRLNSAELVVSGESIETMPARNLPRRPISEHDPQWWEARFRIDSVEKGSTSRSTIVVYYPTSIDIVWRGSPRLKRGQQGILLLHAREGKWLPYDALTALHPLDLQPNSKLQQIRKLLGK
jgi:hypothetical protein